MPSPVLTPASELDQPGQIMSKFEFRFEAAAILLASWLAVLGIAAGIGFAGAAQADGLDPLQARSIGLGGLTGVAYYTVAADGFRVVATLAVGEAAAPVRFIATLTPGQRIVLSVPRGPNETPREVEISRSGDVVSVSDISNPAQPIATR